MKYNFISILSSLLMLSQLVMADTAEHAINSGRTNFPMCRATLPNARRSTKQNEDREIQAEIPLKNGKLAYLSGVSDGHSTDDPIELARYARSPADGPQTSEFISKNLGSLIHSSLDSLSGNDLENPNIISFQLRKIIYKLDSMICEQHKFHDGATLSFALRIANLAYIVNIGDSRTLVYRNNDLIFSSKDHKPSDPAEHEHIKKVGGWVSGNRVVGTLALSRAMGDCGYKLNVKKDPSLQKHDPIDGVIRTTPDIDVIWLAPGQKYTFISGSDGLFDKISNEKVGDILSGQAMSSAKCAVLAHQARERGSKDDITVTMFRKTMPQYDREWDNFIFKQ